MCSELPGRAKGTEEIRWLSLASRRIHLIGHFVHAVTAPRQDRDMIAGTVIDPQAELSELTKVQSVYTLYQ